MSVNVSAFVWLWVDVEFFIFRGQQCLRYSFESQTRLALKSFVLLRKSLEKIIINGSFNSFAECIVRPNGGKSFCTQNEKLKKHTKQFITLSRSSNDMYVRVLDYNWNKHMVCIWMFPVKKKQFQKDPVIHNKAAKTWLYWTPASSRDWLWPKTSDSEEKNLAWKNWKNCYNTNSSFCKQNCCFSRVCDKYFAINSSTEYFYRCWKDMRNKLIKFPSIFCIKYSNM